MWIEADIEVGRIGSKRNVVSENATGLGKLTDMDRSCHR